MKNEKLKKYQQKRKFDLTPEPVGKIEEANQSRFVIHKHQASHLHYDFRLEMDGVLRSWAVPKGLPEEKGIKRLAVQVEDHPIDYINFSGIIPEGSYGAGRVEIWDKGKYKLLEKEEKVLKIELEGEIIKGVYVLVLMRKNQWLIYKV